MQMTLLEKSRHTKIVCTLKEYAGFATYIDALILVYGGQKIKRNSRYIHFEIFDDVLNRKKKNDVKVAGIKF